MIGLAQMTFSDVEYGGRKYQTRKDRFLKEMDGIIPWDEWMELIRPVTVGKNRGRPAREPGMLLRMLLLQDWYGLSGPGCEEAVMDSYAMRTFAGIDFINDSVPDATTLSRFRRKLAAAGITEKLEKDLEERLSRAGLRLCRGTNEDAFLRRSGRGRKRKPSAAQAPKDE